MTLHHLSIRTKLLLGFGVVLLIAALQSLLSLQRLGAVEEESALVVRKWVAGMKVLVELNRDLGSARAARLQLLLADSDAAVVALDKEITALGARVEAGREA